VVTPKVSAPADPEGFSPTHHVAPEGAAGGLAANRAVAVQERIRRVRLDPEGDLPALTRSPEFHPESFSFPSIPRDADEIRSAAGAEAEMFLQA
jgi:hypothetical protein